jgi:alkylation response protein AidB-like acyl-CoA dehydrogenase
MDLTFSADEDAFRSKARGWLDSHVPAHPLLSLDTAEGFEQHRLWEATMGADRWSAVSWPEKYGGRGVDLVRWLIFEEEYYRAGGPLRVNQNGITLLGPTLLAAGTEEQRTRFLPRMVTGEDIWCQGWSEPNAGSDLAAIRSRATLTSSGATWTLNGQKTWCSRGAFADWMFGLFRSDPTAERHHGLTYILLRMDSPGVTVRPIAQLDGETGFAEVFLDDVVVDAANTLGDIGLGWQVAMATTGFERGVSLRSPARFTERARRLVHLYRRRPDADPTLARDVVDAWVDAETYRLHTYMTVSRLLEGGELGAESSLNKVFWSEMDLRTHAVALRILGVDAELLPGALDEPADREWLDGWLSALGAPIFAGTNEIQRNIIAERVLRLPRGG